MPTFRFRAVDLASHQEIEGALEAPDEGEARQSVRARGALPLAIASVGLDPEGSPLARLLARLTKRSLGREELVLFVRQLAALLEAGMPIVESLRLLERQATGATLRAAIGAIREDLLAGQLISEALANRGDVFPPLMLHLARAGEVSGELELMLGRLADMLEQELEIERKVRDALIYPAVVMVALAAVVLVLLVVVVPAIGEVFGRVGAALPLPTRVLLALGHGLRDGAVWVAMAVVTVAFGYRWFRQTPIGRPIVDRAWLHLPIFGPLILEQQANTFTRAFGTVYGAGVPVVKALEACRDLVTNRAIADVLSQAQRGVEAGRPLAETLEASPYFPPVLAQMIAIGEASGRLEELTAKAVAFSDRELDHRVKRLTTLIEPAMTVVLGLTVGFIALALYLPLFDLPRMLMKT